MQHRRCSDCRSLRLYLHRIEAREQGADGLLRAPRMPGRLAVEFRDELGIGPAMRIDIVGKFFRRAGLDLAAQRIREQHGVRVRRDDDPVAFGVVDDRGMLAFGPRDPLLARHLAQLVDETLGRGMQHCGVPS